MIVVDTNVVVYYCLDVELTHVARELAARDPVWCAPELWRSEFRNVLAGEMRRRNLNFQSACTAMAFAEQRMGGHVQQTDSGRVLRLVAETSCTAYDLEFVALAQALDVPLVTMDRKILLAFPGLAVPLVETKPRPAR